MRTWLLEKYAMWEYKASISIVFESNRKLMVNGILYIEPERYGFWDISFRESFREILCYVDERLIHI